MSPHYEQRLYYADPYATCFEARVIERLSWNGQPAVILDHTAFYPTSGGQPADSGVLGEVPVVDVEVRESDDAIVHVLGDELAGDQVRGEIDWARRFDHMQQHTGQHILSAACEQLLDADTVSFHLGSEICTIDLNVSRLSDDSMEPVEEVVNRIIWEDREVTARWVDPDELNELPLRRPPQVEGPLRLVGVADFDLNPCGGTHVARTGEIGVLKIIRLDYRGDETRVEFLCGRRALDDYRSKNETVLALSANLTVGHWEVEEAVERLEEDFKAARRELRTVRERLLEEEAARLVREAPQIGPLRVIRGVWEGRDPGELRSLAQTVASHPQVIALLSSLGERTHLCVARSEGVDVDAEVLLKEAFVELDGKGGGRPHLAQGSAPQTERARVEEVLAEVVSGIRSSAGF